MHSLLWTIIRLGTVPPDLFVLLFIHIDVVDLGPLSDK